jgi:tRNA A-37 threonylcarbamoyl transferase component Bud32
VAISGVDGDLIVPEASAKLIGQIQAKREQTDARVFLLENIDDADAPLVVKTLSRQRRLWLRRLLTRLCYRLLVKKAQKPRPAKRGRYAHEVNRLLQVRQAGANVPSVVAVYEDYLVMSYAGESVEEAYKHGDDENAKQIMQDLAQDLANFHLNNCWHGGAQIRNIHRLHGDFCRFDFEEDLDRDLPLPALQVIDLLLFISSLLKVDGQTDIDAEVKRVKPAIETYQQTFSHPAQKSIIHSAMSFLRKVLWLLKFFPNGGGKEKLRILIILGLFNNF